jgi:catechol 2,3-dioxygenase-like lactoylglutathione lyase family enzyme
MSARCGSVPRAATRLSPHFIVSDDVERSRRFYTEVLGGVTVRSGEPTYVALANGWIIINGGGVPTEDKPTVTLEAPRDVDRVSSFLNLRVADIQALYSEWSARGAEFLTPPIQRETEIRCYIRDPEWLPHRGWADDPPAVVRLKPQSLPSQSAPNERTSNARRPRNRWNVFGLRTPRSRERQPQAQLATGPRTR